MAQENPLANEFERVAMMTAVGECHNIWSIVEVALGQIYLQVIQSKDFVVALAAFDSVQSFQIRLDMTDAAIIKSHTLVDDKFKAAWSPMYNKLVRLNKKRNQVAHFSLTLHNAEGKPARYVLLPYNNASAFLSGLVDQVAKGLTLDMLRARINSFSLAQQRLFNFVLYLNHLANKTEASLAPEGDPLLWLHNPNAQTDTEN